MKYTNKLVNAEPGSFHILDEAKAKRLNAKTLYIPSVADVVEAIRAIPQSTVRASEEVRTEIAIKHGADLCCPAKFKSYWRWSAYAMEQEKGPALPWWRMTKSGRPYDQLPGGAEQHSALIASEQNSKPE